MKGIWKKGAATAAVLFTLMALSLTACGKKTEPPATPEERLALAQAMAEEKAEVDALIEAIGEPASTTYVSSCLGDGEDGQLEYEGFTVYTYRDATGKEAIQDVLETGLERIVQ